MEKLNIAVIFGGVSTEHEVSRVSATTIIENLDCEKYTIELIGITRGGRFLRYTGDVKKIASGEWENDQVQDCVISPSRQHKGILLLSETGYQVLPVDCVIPALHGKNGEDGTIQGLLQLAGIPFVGCDALASASCMDKEITHIILESAGVRMAQWFCVRPESNTEETYQWLEENLGYPMFAKPANAGSSFGVSKATDRKGLIKALELAFQHDHKVIVEEAIVGQEVECSVLGNEDARASIAGEIESANIDLYDYEAKYVNPQSKLYIPARITESTMSALRDTAVWAYRAIGCAGLSRVDFFVTDQDEIILNEINTLPGFTSISMYPKLWDYTGVPIGQLLDQLIHYGIAAAQKRA